MRKPQGYVTVVGDSLFLEYDTITCGHCNKIVHVKPGSASTVYVFPQLEGPPKEEMGAMCMVCMRPVCLQCHDIGTCTPLEKWVLQNEAEGQRKKAMAR